MNNKGMTLVELLVVMVVASVIGIFVLNLFTTSNRTFMDQNKILDAQRDGRLVMVYVTRTLREAGLNPLSSPDFQGLREVGLNRIRIDRDSNLNGILESSSEIISFNLKVDPDDNTKRILMRGFDEGAGNIKWQDMARNITAFNLNYFDENGNVAPTLADIRSIEVTVTFQDTKNLGDDFTRTYSTRVDLRNL